MEFLDMQTVFAGYVACTAICAIVIGLLWGQGRERTPGVGLWLVFYSMQFVGLALITLRGAVPDLFSIVIANALIIGATLPLYKGLGRFLGKDLAQLHNYVILAAYVLIHSYLTYVQPSLMLRNVNSAIALLLMSAQIAWLMLSKAGGEYRPASTATGLLFAGLVLVSATRAYVNLTGPQVQDLFQSGPSDVAAILVQEMVFISLTFLLFLLVSRRFLNSLERDVVEREEAAETLRKSEYKFSVAFNSVFDAILITRVSDGMIVEANESSCTVLGYRKDDMIGSSTLDLDIWADPADRTAYLDRLVSDGQVTGFECLARRKSGELFPAILSGRSIEFEEGQRGLTVIHDATESELAKQQLLEMAERDPLTGVLNHRAFYAVAENRLASIGDSSAAILFLDVDCLKQINDEYGHPVGDRAIVVLAETLRETFRESDIVGRLGGDEFAVLAVSRDDVSDEALIARFDDALLRKNETSGLPVPVATSIGIARWDPASDPADLHALVSIADARMYEAKRVHRCGQGTAATPEGS
ncbi:MAG: sensor domain-containing diguanylate cyclase [Coriobacteriia bacterium]